MNRLISPLVTALWIALAAANASAHEYRRGGLQIDHPWARSTPPMAKSGAVYLEIRNTGGEPERLLGVSTPVAEKAELHRTAKEGDVLTMREVPVLAITPEDLALLHPGGCTSCSPG